MSIYVTSDVNILYVTSSDVNISIPVMVIMSLLFSSLMNYFISYSIKYMY